MMFESSSFPEKIPRNVPPTKLKYLWIFLTGPARLYRRLEWWCISRMLESKAMNRFNKPPKPPPHMKRYTLPCYAVCLIGTKRLRQLAYASPSARCES
eukprot:sb/3478866/